MAALTQKIATHMMSRMTKNTSLEMLVICSEDQKNLQKHFLTLQNVQVRLNLWTYHWTPYSKEKWSQWQMLRDALSISVIPRELKVKT